MKINQIVVYDKTNNKLIDTNRVTTNIRNIELEDKGDSLEMTYETDNNYCDVLILKENITHVEVYRNKEK